MTILGKGGLAMHRSPVRQRGAALLVSLVFLALFALFVLALIGTSQINVRIAANTQARTEVAAAAQQVIEEVVSRDFTANPLPVSECVDVNGDGNCDYTVNIARPRCLNAVPIKVAELDPMASPDDNACNGSLGVANPGIMPPASIGDSLCSNSQWDVNATASSTALWGAATSIHQGVAKRVDVGTSC